MIAFSLKDILFRWPQQEACLDIPFLEIAPGERAFLHGPSGSGKSTLLSLMAGVLTPERGEIVSFGLDLKAMHAPQKDRHRADHIGVIFQLFNLIPYLSALDNILLPCRFSTLRRQRIAAFGTTPESEARRLAEHLGLDRTVLQRQATALSVGQQQRLAASRALIGRPGLVIADEPTSALDTQAQQAFVDLLLTECKASGAALLFVSHDVRLASHFDRVLAFPEINRVGAGDNAA